MEGIILWFLLGVFMLGQAASAQSMWQQINQPEQHRSRSQKWVWVAVTVGLFAVMIAARMTSWPVDLGPRS